MLDYETKSPTGTSPLPRPHHRNLFLCTFAVTSRQQITRWSAAPQRGHRHLAPIWDTPQSVIVTHNSFPPPHNFYIKRFEMHVQLNLKVCVLVLIIVRQDKIRCRIMIGYAIHTPPPPPPPPLAKIMRNSCYFISILCIVITKQAPYLVAPRRISYIPIILCRSSRAIRSKIMRLRVHINRPEKGGSWNFQPNRKKGAGKRRHWNRGWAHVH